MCVRACVCVGGRARACVLLCVCLLTVHTCIGCLQLHCQREYGRDHAHFVVRAPGRIFADNLVCFPYFTDCCEGDGGLAVIP